MTPLAALRLGEPRCRAPERLAAEREAEAAADKAHREATQKTATPKKPRRRSENLDPDMEA